MERLPSVKVKRTVLQEGSINDSVALSKCMAVNKKRKPRPKEQGLSYLSLYL